MINCENIDSLAENEDGSRMTLVYYVPSDKNPAVLVKKTEAFECAENALILKAFRGIRNNLFATGGIEGLKPHDFQVP